jgi:hypothetical protein
MAAPPVEIIPTPKEASFSRAWVSAAAWGLADGSQVEGLAARYAAALGLTRSPQQANLSLRPSPRMDQEEYRLEIAAAGATVEAASERGFMHALSTLRQLKDGSAFPVGKLRDYPRLRMRGFHFMFESFRQLDGHAALRLIATAAKLKLNTLLLEFGDRSPFENHPVVRAPSALTRDDIAHIVALAREHAMQVIPLQQSLGHLNYLLRHDEYAAIREEDAHRDQMCPSNPHSFDVFTDLAEEVLSLFPGTTHLHIGADETRRLGECPLCRPLAEREGKGALYLRHINRVCEWLDNRGITPILWDDILCAHPHLMDRLHESAWVMYWDYWTTQSPSPLLIARYHREGKSASVYDEGWQTQWKRELSDVTASTLESFATPVPLLADLGEQFLAVYGSYLGDQMPKCVRAFPYLEYYQDHGRRVICGPTCSGNTSRWLDLPDFPRYGCNIRTFADRCQQASAEGLITTSWYNRAPEVLDFGLLATAQATW